MQIEFVIICEFAFSRDSPFPGRDVRDDKREQAQCVVGWDDRETEHIAEGHGDEEGFHTAAHFEGMLFEFITEHSVQELAHCL